MPERWRAAAVVASGLLVGILTAIPTGILALNVAVGVAWSNIHGGASDLALTVLPLVAIAVPFGVQALSHRTQKAMTVPFIRRCNARRRTGRPGARS